MSNRAITVYAAAMKRKQEDEEKSTSKEPMSTLTRKPTHARDPSRTTSRATPRVPSRGIPRQSPTRNEIQEFSFSLRDELKVKVQAEVPHHWQAEFDELARKLNVKKLELYRFILGEFLGKVQRRKPAGKEPCNE